MVTELEIWNYLEDIRKKHSDSFIHELNNIENIKPINHRNEIKEYSKQFEWKNIIKK